MPKYKIGITEAGDAGLDLSWTSQMNSVDGAILITKFVNEKFSATAMEYKNNVILHTTITGYGGTILEPYVPRPVYQHDRIINLVECGFPKEHIVIRVDPIIPTPKGCETAFKIIKTFINDGFYRFRISLIDMYGHVKRRFNENGLPLPYGDSFRPKDEHIQAVNNIILAAKRHMTNIGHPEDLLRVECCAEPGLTGAIQCGCISDFDLKLLNLDIEEADSTGYQRKHCMCYSGKTELLKNKHQCPYKCLYCYWRTKI